MVLFLEHFKHWSRLAFSLVGLNETAVIDLECRTPTVAATIAPARLPEPYIRRNSVSVSARLRQARHLIGRQKPAWCQSSLDSAVYRILQPPQSLEGAHFVLELQLCCQVARCSLVTAWTGCAASFGYCNAVQESCWALWQLTAHDLTEVTAIRHAVRPLVAALFSLDMSTCPGESPLGIN